MSHTVKNPFLFHCDNDIDYMHFILVLERMGLAEIETLVKDMRDYGAKLTFDHTSREDYAIVLTDVEDKTVCSWAPAFSVKYVQECIKRGVVLDIDNFRQEATKFVKVKSMDVVYYRKKEWLYTLHTFQQTRLLREANKDSSTLTLRKVPESLQKEVSQPGSSDKPLKVVVFEMEDNSLEKVIDFLRSPGEKTNNNTENNVPNLPKEKETVSVQLPKPKNKANTLNKTNFVKPNSKPITSEKTNLPKLNMEQSTSEKTNLPKPVVEQSISQKTNLNKLNVENNTSGKTTLLKPNDKPSTSLRPIPLKPNDKVNFSKETNLADTNAEQNISRNNEDEYDLSSDEEINIEEMVQGRRFLEADIVRINEKLKLSNEDGAGPSRAGPSRAETNKADPPLIVVSSSDEDIDVEDTKVKTMNDSSDDEWFRNCGRKAKNSPLHTKRTRIGLYTTVEDEQILQYIIQRRAYERVKGRDLWVTMERRKVCGKRTWQSMKNRLIKYIVPEINRYPFVTAEQKALLRASVG